jgi:hypothetical protein
MCRCTNRIWRDKMYDLGVSGEKSALSLLAVSSALRGNSFGGCHPARTLYSPWSRVHRIYSILVVCNGCMCLLSRCQVASLTGLLQEPSLDTALWPLLQWIGQRYARDCHHKDRSCDVEGQVHVCAVLFCIGTLQCSLRCNHNATCYAPYVCRKFQRIAWAYQPCMYACFRVQ